MLITIARQAFNIAKYGCMHNILCDILFCGIKLWYQASQIKSGGLVKTADIFTKDLSQTTFIEIK